MAAVVENIMLVAREVDRMNGAGRTTTSVGGNNIGMSTKWGSRFEEDEWVLS